MLRCESSEYFNIPGFRLFHGRHFNILNTIFFIIALKDKNGIFKIIYAI